MFLNTLRIERNGHVETDGAAQTQVPPHRSSVENYPEAVFDFLQQAHGYMATAISNSPPKHASACTDEHLHLLIEYQMLPRSPDVYTKPFSKILQTVPTDLSATPNLIPFMDYHIK